MLDDHIEGIFMTAIEEMQRIDGSEYVLFGEYPAQY
jgi:hypothetical protein